MKQLMNLSKLAITALITSSVFVACSDKIEENSVDAKYTANTSSIKNAGQAVDLGLPSGTKWANMNVGATSESDNGILFVWGDATGNQVQATDDLSYLNVTEETPVSTLFKLYQGEKKDDGTVCDTTSIVKLEESKLINTSSITEDVKIREAILSFVKVKLADLRSKSYTKLLEATLENEEFQLIINLNEDGEYIERYPNLKDVLKIKDRDVTLQDTLDYFKKYQYEKVSKLNIEEIGLTQVSYYFSGLANNYAEVKDLFGNTIRKDYTGGVIGNAPKDRLDDKKKNNLHFVPVYSIISDASHDPATANWGGNWRMPSTADFVELLEYCKWEFVGNGYRVSSKAKDNNNSIFLPAAGFRYKDQWYGNGNAGYYATGEITGTYNFPSMAEQLNGSEGSIGSSENMPNMLIFQHGQYNSLDIYNNLSTSFGVSVRPVTK
jgi:hypothetical protein